MKKFYFLLASLSSFAAFAQPSNDECWNAIPVQVNPDYSETIVMPGSLTGATPSNVPDNGPGTPSDDVWFSFVATHHTHSFSMLNRGGAVTDLVHEVMSGTCENLVSLSVSDPESSHVSNLVPGNTYYVRVFSYWSAPAASATFDLCIGTPPAPPANDDCAGAISLQVNPDFNCGNTTAGTLAGATQSDVPDNGTGTPNDDVWFSFVATSTSHRIELLDITGVITDLAHEVLSGDCNELTSLSVSDPEMSTVHNLVIGQTYYVRVFSWPESVAGNTSFNVCIGTPPAPPANDDCEGAIALTVNPDMNCNLLNAGTIASATPSNVPDNGSGNPTDDVWFRFVATSASHRISLKNIVGDETDLVHEVLSGTCDGLTSIHISDPETSMVSGLTPGATYYLRIFSYYSDQSESTTFNICIETPPTLTNDECSNAIALTVNPDFNCGSMGSGTLLGATPSNVPDNGAGTPDDDVWFTFVATNTVHSFSLLNLSGSTSDLVHEIMSGNCDGLVSMNISDPEESTVDGFIPGNTYYIRVFSFYSNSAATTIFNICVGTPPPPPANDDCIDAIALTPAGTLAESAIDASVASATDSEAPAPGCAGYSGGDIWFSVVIPASGNLTVETTASSTGIDDFDSGMAIYEGSCGNLTLVDCNDDDGDERFSRISLSGRTPGEVVYVRVWEYSNDEIEPFAIGAYDASLSTPSFDNSAFRAYPNPVNDVLNLSYANNIDSVEVFNLLGQQVFSQSVNQSEYALNMAQLPAGTYLVKVSADATSKTVKVLKK